MAEDNEESKQEAPSQDGGLEKLTLVTRQDGHRAPLGSPWITDEELWFMDWAFRDTVRALMREGIKFELKRYEGTPNFPPLLLQKGYGVALAVRRTKAACHDVGPIQFDATEDNVFLDSLCILANDIKKARFRHADLIFSVRITTFFAHRKPKNAPKWWSPDAEMDRDECEFSTAAEGSATPDSDRACRGSRAPSRASVASPTPTPPRQGPPESDKMKVARQMQLRKEAKINPRRRDDGARYRRESDTIERRPWRPAG